MNRKFSLGYLMLPGLPPPELIGIAAEVGCGGVSLSAALSTMMTGQPSLLDDRPLRDATARAFRDFGTRFDLVEGVFVAPETDLARARSALEVMRELGADRFNLSVWEPDADRAADLMSGFLEIGADLEMRITIEFLRLSQVRSLLEALPPDVVVALEVPMRARAEAGVSPLERARLAADGARRLLA